MITKVLSEDCYCLQRYGVVYGGRANVRVKEGRLVHASSTFPSFPHAARLQTGHFHNGTDPDPALLLSRVWCAP